MAKGVGRGVGGGQPTKFNQEMIDKLVDGIRKVFVLRHAAGLAEVHVVSVYNWLNQGEQDIREGRWTEHARFFYALKRMK